MKLPVPLCVIDCDWEHVKLPEKEAEPVREGVGLPVGHTDALGLPVWQPDTVPDALALRLLRLRLAEEVAHVLGEAKMHDAAECGRLGWIKGFYSDSLTTPGLAADRQMRAALLVDCDVDLYISAAQCLTWLFESGRSQSTSPFCRASVRRLRIR